MKSLRVFLKDSVIQSLPHYVWVLRDPFISVVNTNVLQTSSKRPFKMIFNNILCSTDIFTYFVRSSVEFLPFSCNTRNQSNNTMLPSVYQLRTSLARRICSCVNGSEQQCCIRRTCVTKPSSVSKLYCRGLRLSLARTISSLWLFRCNIRCWQHLLVVSYFQPAADIAVTATEIESPILMWLNSAQAVKSAK